MLGIQCIVIPAQEFQSYVNAWRRWVQFDAEEKWQKHNKQSMTQRPKLSRKHEAFARALFEGLAKENPAWKAYMAAGYTKHEPSARADSARLLKEVPAIIERVCELQREAAAKSGETVEKVTGELNAIIRDARQDRSHNAAIAGVGLKSKILGLVVDRVEQGKPGEFALENAKDSKEFARNMLIDAGLTPDAIRPDQVESAKAELSRFSQAIRAIAHSPAPAADDHDGLTFAEGDSAPKRYKTATANNLQ
jgi:hypothetical protein